MTYDGKRDGSGWPQGCDDELKEWAAKQCAAFMRRVPQGAELHVVYAAVNDDKKAPRAWRENLSLDARYAVVERALSVAGCSPVWRGEVYVRGKKAAEFARRLADVEKRARAEVNSLLAEFCGESALAPDWTDTDGGGWEYAADGLAELCGLIHDRLKHGQSAKPARGRSMVEKLRKAIGYTYP